MATDKQQDSQLQVKFLANWQAYLPRRREEREGRQKKGCFVFISKYVRFSSRPSRLRGEKVLMPACPGLGSNKVSSLFRIAASAKCRHTRPRSGRGQAAAGIQKRPEIAGFPFSRE
jgi:hypothetical protein